MAVGNHVPVTQTEIRDFCKIESAKTSMNDRLDKIADGVAALINKYLNVTMITTEYTETYDGWSDEGDYIGSTLFVQHYPIVSITSLSDNDTAISSSSYYLYKDEGRIVLKDDSFTNDYQSIDIVYKAGYGTARANVPDSLKLACYKWIKVVYEGDVVDFSQQFGESSFAVVAKEAMPADIKGILEPYRCREI